MRSSTGLVICLMAFGLAGCGWRSGSVTGDSERAREVLIVALDAWKLNQVPLLATQSPPIRLQDDDQIAGCQLLSYELPKTGISILPFRNVEVVLELSDPQGKRSRKAVAYQVGLVPVITVLRSDN